MIALLEQQGQCDPRAVDRGRRVAAESGQRLDRVLIQLGLVSERDLAAAFAHLLGLPLAGARPLPRRAAVRRAAHRPLPAPRARAAGRWTGDGLVVAMADPLDDFTPAAIAAATGRRCGSRSPCRSSSRPRSTASTRKRADRGRRRGRASRSEDDAERLKDLASEAPVIRLVNQLIARAVETHASDIHIEPFEDRLRVRYRYDGVLHEAESPPAGMTAAITSRIKIMARLDIAERRLPQDGRIKLAVRGHEVDFRVSTIPSLHGETVVLRVLDRSAVAFDYDQLGLRPGVVARWSGASTCRTASCWSPGPPAAARPPRSTPG